jgi:hypothetical protein
VRGHSVAERSLATIKLYLKSQGARVTWLEVLLGGRRGFCPGNVPSGDELDVHGRGSAWNRKLQLVVAFVQGIGQFEYYWANHVLGGGQVQLAG